jgi:hypothetical protein
MTIRHLKNEQLQKVWLPDSVVFSEEARDYHVQELRAHQRLLDHQDHQGGPSGDQYDHDDQDQDEDHQQSNDRYARTSASRHMYGNPQGSSSSQRPTVQSASRGGYYNRRDGQAEQANEQDVTPPQGTPSSHASLEVSEKGESTPLESQDSQDYPPPTRSPSTSSFVNEVYHSGAYRAHIIDKSGEKQLPSDECNSDDEPTQSFSDPIPVEPATSRQRTPSSAEMISPRTNKSRSSRSSAPYKKKLHWTNASLLSLSSFSKILGEVTTWVLENNIKPDVVGEVFTHTSTHRFVTRMTVEGFNKMITDSPAQITKAYATWVADKVDMFVIPPPEEPKLPYLWNKFIPVLKEFDAELDEFIQQGHDAQDIQALFIRNNRILEVSFQSFRQPQEGYAIS